MEEKEESSNISMLLTDLDSDILEVSSEGRWGVFYCFRPLFIFFLCKTAKYLEMICCLLYISL